MACRMDVFHIPQIKRDMAGKIKQIPGLYLLFHRNLFYRKPILQLCVSVNDNPIHQITHKRKAGTVYSFCRFARPAVLCPKIAFCTENNFIPQSLLRKVPVFWFSQKISLRFPAVKIAVAVFPSFAGKRRHVSFSAVRKADSLISVFYPARPGQKSPSA